MNFEEFCHIAVPQYIRDREAQKNAFVSWSRWVAVREAYFLNRLGVTGNMVSLFRLFLCVVALMLFSRFGSGDMKSAIAGIVIMAWQFNLDSVDGALARVQGVASEFGNCLDNLGIDYARSSFWVLVAAMTGDHILLIPSILAGYLLVPFKQYLGIETGDRVDQFIRYFIYVPVLWVIVPLAMIGFVLMGASSQVVCYSVSIFYIVLAGIWFVIALWKNLITNKRQ